MLLLGYDLGSSSVKASIVDANTGQCIASAFHPKEEMIISAPKSDWAEQDPDSWWDSIKAATREALQTSGVRSKDIKGIGISYQMHGLVLTDKNNKVLRPSIIWCDSRAVAIGEKAFAEIGEEKCLQSLLNSPGNFTASKLKWVKENEPEIYNQIEKIMLPGDYIALRMTGVASTTLSGLSEGIFWDFPAHKVSSIILDYYGFENSFIPELVPNIGPQGELSRHAAEELGLEPGTPLTYRAGDQPNNALSLNVLNPGEIAATAGTSGVVFGVSNQIKYDPLSRVNTFAHVNHTKEQNRLGVLLCINGTGSMNAWLKRNIGGKSLSYDDMNALSASVKPGAEGLKIVPFGNGAERITGNKDMGCILEGLNFNRHNQSHFIRAAHEGIVYAFKMGMDIMLKTGIEPSVIRAGHSNMFLSPVFRECLASITNTTIELYNTDGSQGAARAAGLGAGIFSSESEAFKGLERINTIEPDEAIKQPLLEVYESWKALVERVY
jgi:xylulokinase